MRRGCTAVAPPALAGGYAPIGTRAPAGGGRGLAPAVAPAWARSRRGGAAADAGAVAVDACLRDKFRAFGDAALALALGFGDCCAFLFGCGDLALPFDAAAALTFGLAPFDFGFDRATAGASGSDAFATVRAATAANDVLEEVSPAAGGDGAAWGAPPGAGASSDWVTDAALAVGLRFREELRFAMASRVPCDVIFSPETFGLGPRWFGLASGTYHQCDTGVSTSSCDSDAPLSHARGVLVTVHNRAALGD